MQYRDIKSGSIFKVYRDLSRDNTWDYGLKLENQKAVNLTTSVLMSISDQSRDFELLDVTLKFVDFTPNKD